MTKYLKPIDADTKRTLLKWIVNRQIDINELSSLNAKYMERMTDDELQTELDRLCKYQHAEQCERLQRLGYCKYKDQK